MALVRKRRPKWKSGSGIVVIGRTKGSAWISVLLVIFKFNFSISKLFDENSFICCFSYIYIGVM